jgi:hypothetical protein
MRVEGDRGGGGGYRAKISRRQRTKKSIGGYLSKLPRVVAGIHFLFPQKSTSLVKNSPYSPLLKSCSVTSEAKATKKQYKCEQKNMTIEIFSIF